MSGIRSLLFGVAGVALCLVVSAMVQAAETHDPSRHPNHHEELAAVQVLHARRNGGAVQRNLAWKMPPDVEMDVGPTTIHPLPKPFWDAVEKYSAQTQFIKLPNGAYKLENYVAGVPFPHPSGPDKGTEIAADVTFRPGGHLYVGMPDSGTPSSFCTMDKFGTKACTRVDYNYRQLAYNWFPVSRIPSPARRAPGMANG